MLMDFICVGEILCIKRISNINQIHEHVNYLTDIIKYSRDAAVPLNFHNKYAIQLIPELKMMIKDRNDFKRRWQRNRDSHLKTK